MAVGGNDKYCYNGMTDMECSNGRGFVDLVAFGSCLNKPPSESNMSNKSMVNTMNLPDQKKPGIHNPYQVQHSLHKLLASFEIRSLRVPYPLIQTVVLRDVRHIHQGNNAVIVFLNNSIYGLFLVPLGAQGRANIPLDSGARELATILDTALLQALLLTGQAAASLDLLKGLNYCDVKICEEILQNGNHYLCLLELYKYNSLHREALKLLHHLVEESKSDEPKIELTKKFRPEMIIEYPKPLCGVDPMIVMEFSMLVLESCPTQTIDLFLSGNIPADLVNSYLKQHAPSMQATYLELTLSMNENGISGNL